MGFEYKIKANFTGQQTDEIQYILKNNITFEKKYKFNHKIFWDFRQTGNTGKMPNISIIFEDDGIYICQYGSSYIWKDLESLRKYIEEYPIEYETVDYQE